MVFVVKQATTHKVKLAPTGMVNKEMSNAGQVYRCVQACRQVASVPLARGFVAPWLFPTASALTPVVLQEVMLIATSTVGVRPLARGYTRQAKCNPFGMVLRDAVPFAFGGG